MGKKREATSVPPVAVPVDRHSLAAALTLFVTRFVVEDKRDQMRQRLLTHERRKETLVAVVRWIRGTKAPLEGADRSPAGLLARFGEISGIHLDEAGARRTALHGALDLGRGSPSLFISDSGHLAMITSADGPPVLCSWS